MTQVLPTLTDEELTLIAPAPSDRTVEDGFGALSTARGCLPLQALDVQARIDGLIARTALTQTFVNAHAEPLEATYVFPLPDRAAVTRFRLEVAGRLVEGELKERGEARREYQQAIDAGHRAAITEEERPGVFTMKVGNLPPGEKATVHLTLVGPLPYSDGEATFRFPLVVAPRYIPGTPLPGPSVGEGTSPDTDAVPDASRVSPPVLLPGFPNPVRLSLSVEVPPSPLVPSHFRSSLHTLTEGEQGHTRVFRLHPGERLNRDFILRFRLAEERVKTSLTLQPDADGLGGTFLLTLVPPASAGEEMRPRDVVFVLDRSGSMAGWKMVAARRALGRMVDTLTGRDRFAVLAFDSVVESPPELGSALVPASDRNRFRAVEFLARVEARGGTEMAEPLARAVEELTARADKGRDRILVLVTDGQVGNEDQLLRQLGARAKELRVFTLGIDRAVNAAFLQRLADLGKGGGSELVESEDRLDEVMDQVHRRIGSPVLTGLRLEPAGVRVVPGSVVPSRLPDLFADAPLLVLGRYRDMPEGAISLQGREAGGGMWLESVDARIEGGAMLAPVWARGRLRELEDRYVTATGDRSALEREIVDTSLRFGVLCRFTAYVAVDRSEVVNTGGQVHSAVQPVEQPEGWNMPAMAQGLTLSGAQPCTAMSAPMRAPAGHSSEFSMRRRLRSAPPPSADAGRQDTKSAMPPVPPPAADKGPAETETVESALARFDVYFDDEEASELSLSLEDEAEDLEPLDNSPRVQSRSRGPVKDDRTRKTKRGQPRGPGLIRRMLDLFRGGERKKGKKAAATPPIDRTPFRRRAADLLRQLEAVADPAVPAVFTALAAAVGALEKLFEDLVAAGDRDPAVERLGRVVLEVRALLGSARPAEASILAARGQAEAALRDWLALVPEPPSPAPAPPPPREGFWK
jgi:Ca-activated chloride channel family protein